MDLNRPLRRHQADDRPISLVAPAGRPHEFRGDAAVVATRDLRAGETLDDERGCTHCVDG